MDDERRPGDAGDDPAVESGRRVPGFDGLQRIGSGGSSTVYRALDLRHQRSVAIKVLDLDASNGPRRTAFQREIEAIGRIGSHPYIVTILGSGFTSDDHPYLVLPLFERGTYSQLVDEHGPLTWPAAVDIGIKLCSAVESVHRAGVVHRDIKPGNLFVGVTPEHPLLADFGISSTIDSERTKTQTMAVTFGYTAPEVLDDERPTPASDIYSLAMTIYRLIQGLHAYYAETPAAVMRKILTEVDRPQLSAGVPPAVAAVVADGLARDPSTRPGSALALARRLQQVQVENGLAPTPVVVADEPPVDPEVDRGVVEAAPAPPSRSLEESMVGAFRQRERRSELDGRQAEESVVHAEKPAATSRRDVGGILAAAIGGGNDSGVTLERSSQGHGIARPSVTESQLGDDGPDRPSLDLPTVVSPRKPRTDRDDLAPVDGKDGRRSRLIGLLVLLVLAALIAGGLAVFYFN